MYNALTNWIPIPVLQAILIVSCFISMAWCIRSYHLCRRLAHPEKNKMKFTGMIVFLLFNLFLSGNCSLLLLIVTVYNWISQYSSISDFVDLVGGEHISSMDANRSHLAHPFHGQFHLHSRKAVLLHTQLLHQLLFFTDAGHGFSVPFYFNRRGPPKI